jgi:hypothetical protein
LVASELRCTPRCDPRSTALVSHAGSSSALFCKPYSLPGLFSCSALGDTNVADNDKPWQDMNPDEQAILIRQISGAVNGLQFRVQDLEEAVKALQEKLKKP